MSKKILLVLGAVLVVAGGVAALSAYEAHVINVTAHIENALYVHPQDLTFGTVFPQEYFARDFDVELSTSFQAQKRMDDVTYVIKQKPKCWNNDPENPLYAPVDYATELCPKIDDVQYVKMLDLCPFLSKLDGDPEDDNDFEVGSYYVDPTPDKPNSGDEFCDMTAHPDANGLLTINGNDLLDNWKIDLKVPPVEDYVGQDWPADCPTVPEDAKDYGCDLWIEVTGFSPWPAS